MVLSDRDILKALESGRIRIDPAPDLETQLGSVSVDFRLGTTFMVFEHSRFSFIDPRNPGSIGHPVWGVEMCILDDHDQPVRDGERGEICIRGHNIMKGYLGRPEATAEALRGGWFHSGDIGVRDADGSYRIVDRKKDMIIRGGFNVYPREVEEVLYAHEAIEEAAVIGVPHQSHGEEVKAVVALAAGARLTESELIAWSKERLAAYKYPRIVEFRDALPKGPTGKILKRELK